MKPIYTLDLETDPFKYRRKPLPFCAGFYTGDNFVSTWGNKCVDEMHRVLYETPPGVVYIHNGGKFDMFYLYHWMAVGEPLMIINGRVVKCYVKCRGGMHEFRDSYAIMPFALEKYKKTEIDYRWFERSVRLKYRKQILSYLRDDCIDLHALCVEFVDRFGLGLTVGGTAIKEFKKLHTFECLSSKDDANIRSRFYYGGRVQRFEQGILTPNSGTFKVYDINQSYPNAMKQFDHPTSAPYAVGTKVTDETFFLTVTGHSQGCFPMRTKKGISFPTGVGTFHVTIHEYDAAIELGLFRCDEIVETVDFRTWARFDAFVDKFHALRYEAQSKGDRIGELLYKYVGNSCYGKFAQNPDAYYSYMLASVRNDMGSRGWERCEFIEFADMVLWRQKSEDDRRYNVATGASITGAARAVLMRGLAGAKRAVYCDTDSIICESLTGVAMDDKRIGAWKLEKSGTKIAIAGKKMYALYDGRKVVKIASKGVTVTGAQICDAARGKTIITVRDAPTYNMTHRSVRFIKRKVRAT